MAALSSLPPPQRAVLALVLEKGRSYAEIAGLLQLDRDAVRDRARLALDALGRAGATGPPPPPDRRAAIGDYLLGQDPDAAAETRAYLEHTPAGRDWARAVTAELSLLDGTHLPAVPDEPPPVPGADPPMPGADRPRVPVADPPVPVADPPTPVTDRPRVPGADPPTPVADRTPPAADPPPPAAAPVSRRGGVLLLAGAALAVVAVVLAVLLLPGGGGSPHRRPAAAAPFAAGATTGTTATPAPAAPGAPTTSTTPAPAPATPAAGVAAQITLTAAAGTTARGLAAVIKRGSQRALAIAAGGLHPTSAHLAYGVWLFNSRADSQLIGFVPPVKADGKISAAAALPTSAGRYHRLVLTQEAGTQATRPGRIVLSGPIPAGAAG